MVPAVASEASSFDYSISSYSSVSIMSSWESILDLAPPFGPADADYTGSFKPDSSSFLAFPYSFFFFFDSFFFAGLTSSESYASLCSFILFASKVYKDK